jgi:hypothetical protein
LAPAGFSNGLPSQAPCRTVFGHIFLTFDTNLRESQVRTFYGDEETTAVRLAALRATGANLVVYDPQDNEDGSFDPRGLPGLRQVYALDGYAILSVTETP